MIRNRIVLYLLLVSQTGCLTLPSPQFCELRRSQKELDVFNEHLTVTPSILMRWLPRKEIDLWTVLRITNNSSDTLSISDYNFQVETEGHSFHLVNAVQSFKSANLSIRNLSDNVVLIDRNSEQPYHKSSIILPPREEQKIIIIFRRETPFGGGSEEYYEEYCPGLRVNLEVKMERDKRDYGFTGNGFSK